MIERIKKNWFKEYKKLDSQFNMGYISFFIIIQTYCLLGVVVMWLLASERLINPDYKVLIKTLALTLQANLYTIIFIFTYPFIYNLIVYTKKKVKNK